MKLNNKTLAIAAIVSIALLFVVTVVIPTVTSRSAEIRAIRWQEKMALATQRAEAPSIVIPPSRQTNDRECDNTLVDVLVSIPNGGAIWSGLSKPEKLEIVKGLTRAPGTIGKYLQDCVSEGWTGYYQ